MGLGLFGAPILLIPSNEGFPIFPLVTGPLAAAIVGAPAAAVCVEGTCFPSRAIGLDDL
jgi:hypothetical protein